MLPTSSLTPQPASTGIGAPTGRSLSALVVGASLAGLLSALALSRAGVEVTVLERSAADRPSGAALGVDARDLARVIGPDAARQVVARLGTSAGSGSVPATWAALHAGLRDIAMADPGIDLRHETPVTHVGQDDAQVWVRNADGTALTASVLVGADGYRSLVRRQMFPEHPEAQFAGYTLWLGVTHERELPGVAWPAGFDIIPADGYYLLGYPLAGEDGSTRLGDRRLGWAWYDATRNDVLHRADAVRHGIARRSLAGSQIPDTAYRGLMQDAKRAWPTPWREAVLRTLERREAICTPISEYVPSRLVAGRTALVGDAAHVPTPMTGMGFAASLADADAIASALQDELPDAVPAALEAYEERRLEPARRLVLGGQQFSRSFTRS
ncbi:FAD-dependent monooxygenase [Cellulomonas sp. Y8]|uniref:FAD-dependent monooxygenase n=1 Tax=Cellulomonas sp. Y8 TaxID=2591145 RepID=UPI003D719748